MQALLISRKEIANHLILSWFEADEISVRQTLRSGQVSNACGHIAVEVITQLQNAPWDIYRLPDSELAQAIIVESVNSGQAVLWGEPGDS